MDTLDEKSVRDIVQKELETYSMNNQYNLSPIPTHSHNGIDSLPIDFTNLVNSGTYMALKTTMLTSAQILALNTTPITLIPKFGNNSSNVGVNYVYIVEGITARIYYNSVAYAGANALEFRYTNASGAKVTADLPNTFINSSANTYAHVAGVTTALTPVLNAPIVVSIPTANPTLGNSRITFVVKYRIVFI